MCGTAQRNKLVGIILKGHPVYAFISIAFAPTIITHLFPFAQHESHNIPFFFLSALCVFHSCTVRMGIIKIIVTLCCSQFANIILFFRIYVNFVCLNYVHTAYPSSNHFADAVISNLPITFCGALSTTIPINIRCFDAKIGQNC